MNKTIRDASRVDYTTAGEKPTWEEVRGGALLRIADAVEKVAQRHTALIDERDMYKRWYDRESERRATAERRIAALQGVITRMKKARQQAQEAAR